MKYKQLNILATGLSGKCGKKVYAQLNGETIVRKAPKKGYNKIPTPAQAIVRERLRNANQFAKTAMNDPDLKIFYSKKASFGISAYDCAVSEYMKAHGNSQVPENAAGLANKHEGPGLQWLFQWD